MPRNVQLSCLSSTCGTLCHGLCNLQVQSNGWVSAGIASAGAGWLVAGTGGMTVDTTGVTILAGGISSTGNVQVHQGSLSIASSYAESALDVHADRAGFTGNAILGRVAFGSDSNAMLLMQDTDVLFQVRLSTSFAVVSEPFRVMRASYIA
jgi:hypothetical protein